VEVDTTFSRGYLCFFALKKAGAQCFLANLTFSDPSMMKDTEQVSPMCWKITADSKRNEIGWTKEKIYYWPEFQVADWFRTKEGIEVPVYMFEHDIGVVPLLQAYKVIVERHNIEAVILVDGGTDSLMFGNEQGVGTPTEDMTSICAVDLLPNVKKKLLFNIGFGVDCFHGVCHHNFLENVCKVAESGGFYGSFSLLQSHEESTKFQQVYEACNPENSIVSSSVLLATQYKFGNVHSKHTASRTRGSQMYITPLMSQYWAFDLNVVASNVLYLDKLTTTQNSTQVQHIIAMFRNQFFSGERYIGLRPDRHLQY